MATCRVAADTVEHPWLHGNLLFAMHANPDCGPEEILAEHRKWGDRFAKPHAATITPHQNDRSPERRLKVGFVSPDFNQHPVGRFMLPLMQNIDRGRFEIFCYSDKGSERTGWLRNSKNRPTGGGRSSGCQMSKWPQASCAGPHRYSDRSHHACQRQPADGLCPQTGAGAGDVSGVLQHNRSGRN